MGAIRAAFRTLDAVDLDVEFSRRANVMKMVPSFLAGPFRNALRAALAEAAVGSSVEDLTRQERRWKLFLLIPRFLLDRGSRGGLISRLKLSQRFETFVQGEWMALLRSGQCCDEQASVERRRVGRRIGDDVERRALRALSLTQMGELSSARQALNGAAIAPGIETTRATLTNPENVTRAVWCDAPSSPPRSRD